ncbi:MAG: hypothetical protein NTX70_11305 [Verrucomicrobia bacterium]|nr:hypothetical protein [Verrucomicrobiota bacterium]
MAMRHFFTGPWIKCELLQTWLEKHGIESTVKPVEPIVGEPSPPDFEDLDREVRILVPEADFSRAHDLFFTEREGEL